MRFGDHRDCSFFPTKCSTNEVIDCYIFCIIGNHIEFFNPAVPTPTVTTVMVSPKIFKFSPESLAAVDVSFESYKQQSKPRKRSFSPIVHEQKMRSPNISPIEISSKTKTTTTTSIRMTPRHVNTPRPKDFKRPIVPKVLIDTSKL